jgi:hypothetical protein
MKLVLRIRCVVLELGCVFRRPLRFPERIALAPEARLLVEARLSLPREDQRDRRLELPAEAAVQRQQSRELARRPDNPRDRLVDEVSMLEQPLLEIVPQDEIPAQLGQESPWVGRADCRSAQVATSSALL